MNYKITAINGGCMPGKNLQETGEELQKWRGFAVNQAEGWPSLIERNGFDYIVGAFMIEAWRALCAFKPEKAGDNPANLMRVFMRNRAKNMLASAVLESRGGGVTTLSIEAMRAMQADHGNANENATSDKYSGVDYADPCALLMAKEEVEARLAAGQKVAE